MHALLIHNPAAGRQSIHRELSDAIQVLADGGWVVEHCPTHGPGHASQLARQAAEAGFDVALVAGGDGTINQVADGLLAAQRAGLPMVALGLLPAGTANVLAYDLGLPVPSLGQSQTIVQAARLLLTASVEYLDVGRARTVSGERTFLCWCGVGLDAAVAQAVESRPQIKSLFGKAFFGAILLAVASQPDSVTTYTIEVDGQPWRGRGILAVASNIRRYATVFTMAPNARLNDGLLDFAFFAETDPVSAMQIVRSLLVGRHARHPSVRTTQARRIVIETKTPQPIHLDAEPVGVTPVVVEVAPRALPVLIPPTARANALL